MAKTRSSKATIQEQATAVATKKSNTVKKAKTVKKGGKKPRQFWVKTYTVQDDMIIMFSEELLGPFETKEKVIDAINEEVKKLEDKYDIEISEEVYTDDNRDNAPNNGRVLSVNNEPELYCFDICTKKPKIFDGADSDGPF